MKKINSLLLIFCFVLTNVFPQDEKVKNLLESLSAKTKSYSSISIDFDYTINNKNAGINEKNSGTLILKGEQFRIDLDKQLIINDGKINWVYLKEMNEVQIMDYDPEEDDMSPNKLITIYEEDYKSAYVETKSENGVQVHIIDLFPSKSGPFLKIRLTINALKDQINTIVLSDKNGGTYSYKINSFKTDSNIPPFTFNKNDYPGVKVIDLR